MLSEELSEQIDNVVKQFLCNVPIQKFIWNDILENLTVDTQETLANRTVNSELVLNYPIEINYQKSFLKHLIGTVEKQNSEIADELYSAYGRLVALPPRSEYFKHYSVTNSGNVVSLKENIFLISDGTTGLRTWQASLVLSEWSLSNVETFRDKTVLELGSGLGLTGITIVMGCSPSCVCLTDGHTSVLKTLRDNVDLNLAKNVIINHSAGSYATSKLELLQDRCVYRNLWTAKVFVLNLPWEDVNKETCEKLGVINKVIAADVVYDPELFDPLISALKCLLHVCSVDEFIFCCTERNKSTLDDFLNRISEASFDIEELEIPPQKNFIWPNDTPIRLLRFTGKRV